MRASEGLNVSETPGLSQEGNREASGLSARVQTYPRRRAAHSDVPTDAVGKLSLARRWRHSLIFARIAQRGALERNAMAAVHDAVQNGIGQGGIIQIGMPGLDRQLAGHQR